MEALKLNDETCFSCLQPFEETRSEINISDNMETLRRMTEVNFLLDRANDTMNLCIPCYNKYEDAKNEYIKLRDLEKRFDIKRKKFAFTIVKSILDDDYLGTSIENNFLNVRAKIYNKWQKEYKLHMSSNSININEVASGSVKKEETTPVATASKIVPKSKLIMVNPVSTPSVSQSPIVSNIVSLKTIQNVAINEGQQIQLVKRDPNGRFFRLLHANDAQKRQYRLKQASGQSHAIKLVHPPVENGLLKIKNLSPPKFQAILPQARPIVRTPIPTQAKVTPVAIAPKPSQPAIIARKSLPVTIVAAPVKRTASNIEKLKSEESTDNVPDKKKARESAGPIIISTTHVSNRSRRTIRKLVDSSCLYGNEYEKAVKLSSKKRKVRTVKRNSDATNEMNDDSYRYEMGDQEEIEEGSFDQFEEDGNIDDERAGVYEHEADEAYGHEANEAFADETTEAYEEAN